ncbi:hypothetical protein BDF22DRAFT_742494 [Syncephalis plumigaleata]|nr:hypothetical protein BDF22DRAFT_742494 [Syncephalis plumigaleata]
MSQANSNESMPSSGGSRTEIEDDASSGYHSSPENRTQSTISNDYGNSRRRRWHRYTCMNTPLEKSGLLYCSATQTGGLVSVSGEEAPDTNDHGDELMSAIMTANAIASSIILDRALHFGGKLSQVEETEEEYVAQLEYLRDYYMRPLLGQQPARAAPRSRGLKPSADYSNAEASTSSLGLPENRRARSGSAPNVTLNLPGNAALNNDDVVGRATFQPSQEVANILSAPFGTLFRMIEQHTLFLVALKKARPLDSQPHVLVDIFSDHISRLSLYYTHVKHHAKALSEFETLVFNDERLAQVIQDRDNASKHGKLRALLVTIPVSRLWYYGAVLQSMRERFHNSQTDSAMRKLRISLQWLEELVRRMWPLLKQIGKVQRVAMLQSNIANIKESIMTPTQRIFLMDMVQYKLNDASGTWNSICVILLRDRLLFLKKRTGHYKQFSLKMSISLESSIFTAHEQLPNETIGGIYVQEPRLVDIKLHFDSRATLTTWQKYLNATDMNERVPYARGVRTGASRSERNVTTRTQLGTTIEYARTAQMSPIGNLFGLDGGYSKAQND